MIRAFRGPAGTGKTFQLIHALEERIQSGALLREQAVLALTRMHGSRRRLVDRLTNSTARGRFECVTFDSFAWMLVSRFRTLARERLGVVPIELQFDETCVAAAALLEIPRVRQWIQSRFPLLVVDEFQDCKQGRLAMVKNLSVTLDLLVAADEFQDLECTDGCPAVEWLQAATTPTVLARSHRTTDSGILAGSTALRNGDSLAGATNLKILAARNSSVGAAILARAIAWSKSRELAVLSYSRPENSSFVREVVTKVSDTGFYDRKRKRQFGPYPITWEESGEAMENRLREAVVVAGGACRLADLKIQEAASYVAGQRELEQWLGLQRRLRGNPIITDDEIVSATKRIVLRVRAHQQDGGRRLGMTIHQAKNREFDAVVVLWPFGVRNGDAMQRRMLYNAITRAKMSVTIIVQEQVKGSSRLQAPPFTA